MVTLLIIRHGLSRGNNEKRFSGQMDSPLVEVGLAQAESVSKYVSENFKVDAVYASDLCRACDTVRPIADMLDLPVTCLEALREVDVGSWQGMLVEDVKKEYPKEYEYYRNHPGTFQFPDGESYVDVMHRVKPIVEDIAQNNEGKTIVIGTHGGVIRCLRALWNGVLPENIKAIPHVPNGSVTIVEYEKGEARFVQTGYIEHLCDKTTEEGTK